MLFSPGGGHIPMSWRHNQHRMSMHRSGRVAGISRRGLLGAGLAAAPSPQSQRALAKSLLRQRLRAVLLDRLSAGTFLPRKRTNRDLAGCLLHSKFGNLAKYIFGFCSSVGLGQYTFAMEVLL